MHRVTIRPAVFGSCPGEFSNIFKSLNLSGFWTTTSTTDQQDGPCSLDVDLRGKRAQACSLFCLFIFIIEIVHKVHTQLKRKKKKMKVNWHRETEQSINFACRNARTITRVTKFKTARTNKDKLKNRTHSRNLTSKPIVEAKHLLVICQLNHCLKYLCF